GSPRRKHFIGRSTVLFIGRSGLHGAKQGAMSCSHSRGKPGPGIQPPPPSLSPCQEAYWQTTDVDARSFRPTLPTTTRTRLPCATHVFAHTSSPCCCCHSPSRLASTASMVPLTSR